MTLSGASPSDGGQPLRNGEVPLERRLNGRRRRFQDKSTFEARVRVPFDIRGTKTLIAMLNRCFSAAA
jgi:hypothetical protein